MRNAKHNSRYNPPTPRQIQPGKPPLEPLPRPVPACETSTGTQQSSTNNRMVSDIPSKRGRPLSEMVPVEFGDILIPAKGIKSAPCCGRAIVPIERNPVSGGLVYGRCPSCGKRLVMRVDVAGNPAFVRVR